MFVICGILYKNVVYAENISEIHPPFYCFGVGWWYTVQSIRWKAWLLSVYCPVCTITTTLFPCWLIQSKVFCRIWEMNFSKSPIIYSIQNETERLVCWSLFSYSPLLNNFILDNSFSQMFTSRCIHINLMKKYIVN